MGNIIKKCLMLTLSLLVGFGVVWQLRLTGVSMTESDTEIKASIYTDVSYSELSQDKTVITVAGALPDDVEVRAYPVEVELSGCLVLAAYDISLYRPVNIDAETAKAEDVTAAEVPETEETQSGTAEAEAAADPGTIQTEAVTETGEAESAEVETGAAEAEMATKPDAAETETETASVNETAEAKADEIVIEAVEPAAEAAAAAGEEETATTEYELYEPTEPVTVNIRLPDTVGQDEACSVCYIPDSGAPEPMPSAAAEDGVSFTANHFSVYALTAPAAMSVPVSVNTFTGLQTNIASGGTKVIQLSANISATGTITIPAGSNITLDLNGYSITANSTLFQLTSSTASLTITDSRQGTETTQTVSGNHYGNLATTENNSGKITLNYYVTETAITDSATGATSETLVKHTVTTSAIINNSYVPIVSMTAGTFNMTGGMLYGGYTSAIAQTGGTVNLSDGYICGVNAGYFNNNGGAVKMTAGTLNVSGSAVLAGNTAYYGGAVYASGTADVNITGGIISGNTAEMDGGGVYLDNGATAVMSDGYLTNNVAQGNGWYSGGGGAFVKNSSFTLSGGYITGNAAIGGGGLSTGYNDTTSTDATATSNSGTIYISGGFVTANVATASVITDPTATAHEGGGLCVRDYYYGEITGGYITNNISETTEDWGGGGIFIGEHGTVVIKNLLVTDNTAENYGGGVAGCSTGSIYLLATDGAAIYDNTATGTDPVDGNAKPEAYDYCVGNTVFLSNGYADVFGCNASFVMGEMLGGGAANWSGSKSDGPDGSVIANTIPITIAKNETKSATYLMGLTADPSDADIANAQTAALVYINGNSSDAHGGGIMANGQLVLGTTENTYTPVSLALNGSKSLTDTSGGAADLSDYTFEFDVTDGNGVVASTGTSDGSGTITFDPVLTFSAAGSYIYTITEQENAAYSAVTFDTTQYRITVTVAAADSGTQIFGGIFAYALEITAITVETSTDGGVTWSSPVNVSVPAAADSTVTLSAAASGLDFANTAAESTSVSVQKTWVDCEPADSIQVQLYADGVATGDPVVITAEDDWFYLWTHLLKYGTGGTPIVYTVSEIHINGYDSTVTEGTPPIETTGTTVQSWTSVSSFQAGATYLIVSSSGALANTGGDSLSWAANTSGDAANTPLTSQWVASAQAGGSFKLANKSCGRVLTFVYNGAWVVRAYASGDPVSPYDSAFTYVSSQLRSSPSGYYFDSSFNYGWSSNAPIITLYKLNSTTTTTTAPVSDKHYDITNTASAAVYELPATGGSGTLPYLFIGLVLVAGSSLAGLVWIYRQRRWGGT